MTLVWWQPPFSPPSPRGYRAPPSPRSVPLTPPSSYAPSRQGGGGGVGTPQAAPIFFGALGGALLLAIGVALWVRWRRRSRTVWLAPAGQEAGHPIIMLSPHPADGIPPLHHGDEPIPVVAYDPDADSAEAHIAWGVPVQMMASGYPAVDSTQQPLAPQPSPAPERPAARLSEGSTPHTATVPPMMHQEPPAADRPAS